MSLGERGRLMQILVNRRLLLALGAAGAATRLRAAEAPKLRLGVQASGALSLELAVARARGLEQKFGVAVETVTLATTEAGKIALAGGAVDVILTDWLFVARERALGQDLLFARHSSALGALMARPDALGSGAAAIKNLVGRKIGVAGGSLDKSWLMLQAFALQQGVDLKQQATPVYAAPPLIAEKLTSGELDAALEFWPFVARLQGAGLAPVLTMAEVERALGATGPVAATGLAFSDAFARRNPDSLTKFLAMMAQAAELTARDDAAFAAVAPMTGIADAATLAIFRNMLRDGLIDRPLAEDVADAEKIFASIAALGGVALTGGATRLDPALFYDAAAAAK